MILWSLIVVPTLWRTPPTTEKLVWFHERDILATFTTPVTCGLESEIRVQVRDCVERDHPPAILLDDGRCSNRSCFLLGLPVRAWEIYLIFRGRGGEIFHRVLDAVDDLPLTRHDGRDGSWFSAELRLRVFQGFDCVGCNGCWLLMNSPNQIYDHMKKII